MVSARSGLPRRKFSLRAVSMKGKPTCFAACTAARTRSTAAENSNSGLSLLPVASSIEQPTRPASAASRTVSATTAGESPKPFSRSAETGRSVASTMMRTCASASSRVMRPSRRPSTPAAAPLEVASAWKPRPARMRAEPPSQGFGMTNAPGPSWSCLKRAALSAWFVFKRPSSEPPDYVAYVVRHKERAARVERHADRAAARLALVADEAGEQFHRQARGLAIGERNEHHVVAAQRPAVPRAVLADKGTAAGEDEAERGDMVAERVIRLDCLGDEIGALGLPAGVHMSAVIAVRPAVEGAVAHRGQIVGNEIAAELVALVRHRPQLTARGLPTHSVRIAQA